MIAALWFVGRSETLLTEVLHTEQVIKRTRDLELATKEAESSARAYVITKRPEARANYDDAASDVAAALKDVDELTDDNEDQRIRLGEVRRLVNIRLSRYAHTFALVDGNRSDQLPQSFVEGLKESRDLRVSITEVHEREQALLLSRHEAYGKNVLLYQLLLGLATLVAVVSGLYGQSALRADMRDRDKRLTRERELIDELARRNDELKQTNDTLERTNVELDQFAYVASHDLRAPLRAISSLVSWIEEDLGGKASDETKENIGLVRGRLTRMEALIDGILDYARVGRGKLQKERVETRALVVELGAVALAREAGREVALEGTFPSLVTERVLLEQVLQNLIGNALKHATKGRIAIRAHEYDGETAFTVKDEGPGIDPKYHQRIFGFFQTLAPRDKVESTGIGLAIVKKLVEARGGVVIVDSEPGAGSAFTFTWPA